MKKFFQCIAIALLLVGIALVGSCKQPFVSGTYHKAHAKLIGYTVGDKSEMYFIIERTETFHIVDEGKRKIPTLKLNDSIPVGYLTNGDEVIMLLDGADYCQNAPRSMNDGRIMMAGYE